MPAFKENNNWSLKKSTFGQNDYIDILGDGDISPVDLIRGPPWLIGFKGNELQRIQRQLKFVGKELQAKNKEKYNQLTKRIKYLTWRYNFKFGGIKK
jgi:large subunit ribosomal protein L51